MADIKKLTLVELLHAIFFADGISFNKKNAIIIPNNIFIIVGGLQPDRANAASKRSYQ